MCREEARKCVIADLKAIMHQELSSLKVRHVEATREEDDKEGARVGKERGEKA